MQVYQQMRASCNCMSRGRSCIAQQGQTLLLLLNWISSSMPHRQLLFCRGPGLCLCTLSAVTRGLHACVLTINDCIYDPVTVRFCSAKKLSPYIVRQNVWSVPLAGHSMTPQYSLWLTWKVSWRNTMAAAALHSGCNTVLAMSPSH